MYVLGNWSLLCGEHGIFHTALVIRALSSEQKAGSYKAPTDSRACQRSAFGFLKDPAGG